MDDAGKKTAAAVYEEVTREIEQWLRVLFSAQRKTGQVDLEAVEMLVRAGLHRAGAAGLTAMLEVPAPALEQRTVPCPCGEQAHYQGLRSKPLLTAVAKRKYRVLTTGAGTVMRVSFPLTSNSTSNIRSFLRVCGACWHWWEPMRRLIMAASR